MSGADKSFENWIEYYAMFNEIDENDMRVAFRAAWAARGAADLEIVCRVNQAKVYGYGCAVDSVCDEITRRIKEIK